MHGYHSNSTNNWNEAPCCMAQSGSLSLQREKSISRGFSSKVSLTFAFLLKYMTKLEESEKCVTVLDKVTHIHQQWNRLNWVWGQGNKLVECETNSSFSSVSLTTHRKQLWAVHECGHRKHTYLTHRKRLSLIQIDNQDGWRREISILVGDALVPLQDLDDDFTTFLLV